MSTLQKQTDLNFLNCGLIKAEGWMAEYCRRDAEGFFGRLDELTASLDMRCFGEHRVGEVEEKEANIENMKHWWIGEVTGNWMDGMMRLNAVYDHPRIREKAERIKSLLLADSDGDGYLGLYAGKARYNHEGENGEFWSQSRLLLALSAAYEQSGEPDLLLRMEKAGDLTISKYGAAAAGRSYYNHKDRGGGGTSHGLMMVEAMAALSELTGRNKYSEFAEWCYRDFSKAQISVAYNDLQLKNVETGDRPFLSHGVHTVEHLRVPLILYHLTGNKRYRQAWDMAMIKLSRYLMPSGACKSDETFGAPLWHGSGSGKADFYGTYPVPTSGYEYCAVSELLLSLHWAVRSSGEIKYADMAERLLYNSAMGSRLSHGRAIAYLNADNINGQEHTSWMNKRSYSPTFDRAACCCPPNAGRMMAYHISRLWMTSDADPSVLVAMFYGPCSLNHILNGVPVRIEEETDYPLDDEITFTIRSETETAWGLRLRIPAFCDEYTLSLNGKRISAQEEGGFAVLKRVWGKADRLVLKLSFCISVLKAVDNTMAVARGPLVYALPLVSNEHITRGYKLAGFHDSYFTADEDPLRPYYLMVNKTSGLPQTCEVVINSDSDSGYIWDQSTHRLRVSLLDYHARPLFKELVPLGHTVLRRTCLPFIETDGSTQMYPLRPA